MEKPTRLGKALVDAREAAGFSIREAAQETKTTTYQQIYYWEGRRSDRESPASAAKMPLAIAYELSELYGNFLTIDELYEFNP